MTQVRAYSVQIVVVKMSLEFSLAGKITLSKTILKTTKITKFSVNMSKAEKF